MGVLDLFTIYSRKDTSFTIYRYSGQGMYREVATDSVFKPYFYYMASRERISEFVRDFREYIHDFEETDYTAFVFDHSLYRYVERGDLKVYKIYSNLPSDIEEIMRKINEDHLYGGIVKFDVRASLDLLDEPHISSIPVDKIGDILVDELKNAQNLKILSFDIEVEASSTAPEPGTSRIYSISFNSARLSKYGSIEEAFSDAGIIYGSSNEDIYASFIDLLKREKPDIIVGYNSYDFDLRHLCASRDVCIYNSRYIHIPETSQRFIHIDLMQTLKEHRSSLGVRSTNIFALDDLAVEIGVVDSSSEIYRIATQGTPENINRWFREDRETYEKYSRFDSAVPFIIAQKWIPVLYAISKLSKIPFSMIPSLNEGTIVDYISFHTLERTGIVTNHRRSMYSYGKIEGYRDRIYSMGKVYAVSAGIYEDISVYDFNMLYPTIYTFYQVDPLLSFMSKECIHKGSMKIVLRDQTEQLIEGCFNPVPGPLSMLYSRFYFMRLKIKELLKARKDPLLKIADQAVKILANSVYGAISKPEGNIVNEFASAYIFYRSNKILLDMINAIDSTGRYKVVYGDTDSVFISGADDNLDTLIEREVARFGKLFSMKKEYSYDYMVIPYSTSREKEEATKKTYMLISGDAYSREVRDVVLKGLFYSRDLPVFLDEKREIFLARIALGDNPWELVDEYIDEALEKDPLSLFWRRSHTLEFISRKTGGLKMLNRTEHYIALYMLDKMGFTEQAGDGNIRIFSPRGKSIPAFISFRYIPFPAFPKGFIYIEPTGDWFRMVNVVFTSVKMESDRYLFTYREQQLDPSVERAVEEVKRALAPTVELFTEMILGYRDTKSKRLI